MTRRNAYPRPRRVRRAGDFRHVLDAGEVFPGRQCLVRRLLGAAEVPRLGIAVPRGYGGAVRRNRFRRLVREAFRHMQADLPPMDLMVSPRRGAGEPTLEGLGRDLERAARAPAPTRTPRQPPAGRPT